MTERRARRFVARLRYRVFTWRIRVVALLRPLLPATARRGLHQLDRLVDPLRVGAHRAVSRDSRPVPPKLLRDRVGASTIESYFETGERWAELVETALAAGGRSLSDCQSVLEFGCGAGKVARHLVERTAGEVHGCDIHGPSIEWLERNIPGIQAAHTGFVPPLPYGDSRFDCIYAWSVFSHIGKDAQRAWLVELERVLGDDGVLLISFLSEEGPRYGGVDTDLDREELRRRGAVFIPYETRGAAYEEFAGTSSSGYGLSYITREHVREQWGKLCELTEILPRVLDGQDVAVIRPSRSGEAALAGRQQEVLGG